MRNIRGRHTVVDLMEVLTAMLPSSVRVHVIEGEPDVHPHPAEKRFIATASKRRKAEFLRGRICAWRGLEALGLRREPLLSGPHREPRWPQGIVGSISHTGDVAVAAVARQRDLAAIGVDLEERAELTADVRALVGGDEEFAMLRSSGLSDTTLFSLKESIFKALFPRLGRWVDFHEVSVIATAEGGLTASSADGTSDLGEVALLELRHGILGPYVVTAAWLEQEPPVRSGPRPGQEVMQPAS